MKKQTFITTYLVSLTDDFIVVLFQTLGNDLFQPSTVGREHVIKSAVPYFCLSANSCYIKT